MECREKQLTLIQKNKPNAESLNPWRLELAQFPPVLCHHWALGLPLRGCGLIARDGS
jgi:hypothetical protein